MKRTAALLLAVLMTAVLLPAAPLAETEPECFRLFAEDVYAMGLSVGDTFTVSYLISDECFLSSCEIRLFYPAQYFTPVDYVDRAAEWSLFFKGDGENVVWDNHCECELVCEGGYSLVTAFIDSAWYAAAGGNCNELIDVTYRIDALPYTDSLPLDEVGAFALIEPEVVFAEYYSDLDDYEAMPTEPYEEVDSKPIKVYLPLAPIPWPQFNSVTYTGAEANAKGLEPGDSFYWTFSVSEASRLWGAQWLIDYPEQYVTATAASATWSGGLYSNVYASWDEGTACSDKPEIACSVCYEGMTGGSPVGEEGNMYANVLLYLMSFEYGGVMAGGDVIRLTFTLNCLPCAEEVMHDELGYYFEIPIIVIDSVYWPEGMSAWEAGMASMQHDIIDTVPGRVYVTPADARTIVYSGGAVDAAQLEIGDTVTVAYSVDNADGYMGGLVYIDYPEEYMTPIEHVCPWDGFLPDGGSAMPVELEYDNDGNMLTRVEVSRPYIVSDSGIEEPEGSEFIIITYRIDAMPDASGLSADDNGAYIELPLASQDSVYTADLYSGTLLWYDTELTFPARIYVPQPAPETFTVTFYGFGGELLAEVQVDSGCAAEAPEAPASVVSGKFTYYFICWIESFDCITEDTEVHAKYLSAGDVDGSGEVTFSDIGTLYAYVNGSLVLSPELAILADVNGDGAVNFTDVSILYMLLLG